MKVIISNFIKFITYYLLGCTATILTYTSSAEARSAGSVFANTSLSIASQEDSNLPACRRVCTTSNQNLHDMHEQFENVQQAYEMVGQCERGEKSKESCKSMARRLLMSSKREERMFNATLPNHARQVRLINLTLENEINNGRSCQARPFFEDPVDKGLVALSPNHSLRQSELRLICIRDAILKPYSILAAKLLKITGESKESRLFNQVKSLSERASVKIPPVRKEFQNEECSYAAACVDEAPEASEIVRTIAEDLDDLALDKILTFYRTRGRGGRMPLREAAHIDAPIDAIRSSIDMVSGI